MARAETIGLVLGSVSLLGVLAAGMPAMAQSTDTLTVLANVGGECTVEGGTLDFGNYTGIQKDAQADISFNCNAASNVSIALSGGGNGDPTNRQMSHTGNPGNPALLYQLFQDDQREDLWGVFPTDSKSFPNATSGAPTVFGRLLAGQDTVLAGSYSDTVVITLTTD